MILTVTDIGLLDASVKESFLYCGFFFAILQESGNFPEVIERLNNSVIGLAKTLKNHPLKNDQRDCPNQLH